MNSKITNIAIAAPTLLLSIFVILKVEGLIEWPWWLVVSPIYAPFAALVVLVLLIVGGGIVAVLLEELSTIVFRRDNKQ